MVLKILSDVGVLDLDGDARCSEDISAAYAREFEDLGGLNRSGRDDHLSRGKGRVLDASTVGESDALGFPASILLGEDDFLDLGLGQDDEVRSRGVGEVVCWGCI